MERDCPFCFPHADIIEHEDSIIRILRDKYPVSTGHLLITPRRHVGDWFAASPAEQQALIDAIPLARNVVLKTLQPDGFNVGINIGTAAGQTIPHLHVHLVPRYLGDVPDPTGGVRNVIPGLGNYLADKTKLTLGKPSSSLVRGGAKDPLLEHLVADLDTADKFDLAVAFILPSGVDLLEEHIRDLMRRNGSARILTGDYQNVTDPDALQRLLDIDGDLKLRVYQCRERSFHPKAYLISTAKGQRAAYVGSSNLTKTALCDGVEWNYRIESDGDPVGYREIQDAFESIFCDPLTTAVTPEWLEAYRAKRPKSVGKPVALEVESEPEGEIPSPHEIQTEALTALEGTRTAGNQAGLVVLATGLGKTWLSAFDSSRPEFHRVLFVAHREEILDQAIRTYRRIRPKAHIGKYTGTERVPDAEILFASVQTLNRLPHLRRFSRTAFDYIVVDEFHHAAARTYRKIIDYFVPKFMLGLTATPERTDGGDLLGLCEENLVYRCDIGRGIELGLLSPFHYFGVPDSVDYSNIPWRSNRFDEKELTNAVATEARAQNALEQLQKRGGARTLGFCCSVRHADFMAQFFNDRGVRSAAVHSGPNTAPRAHSLERLRDGELDVVFAVDLFNEGVDIPTVDTVLMLRPTESRVVWQQQFGRGLRVAEGKERLNVIDYIGNHRGFLIKPQTLFDLSDARAEISKTIAQWQAGMLSLPPGCEVVYDLETVRILEDLLRAKGGVAVFQEFYQDFVAMHDHRPTALEAFHAGYNPNATRKQFGSWLGFVSNMGGLTEQQSAVFEKHGQFLEDVSTTQMSRSYKMLLLLAMLNEDALPGSIEIGDLVQAFRRRVERAQFLKADVGEALGDDVRLRGHLERNPIDAWVGGLGTGGRNWFAYDGGHFRTLLDVESGDREPLQDLVRELCDWRLGQYMTKKGEELRQSIGEYVLKIGSASGRPIVFPLNREKLSGLPYGTVPVRANDEEFEADFVKVAVNVMRRPGTGDNVITDVLRGWFGPDAGLPGTSHHVVLEEQEGYWTLAPQGKETGITGPDLWRPYMRASIPGLFGEPYVENKWRQGFIREGAHLFLLVTLEKAGMATEHQYADKFLSPNTFEWQSQNRQARHLPSGKILREYAEKGLTPHLFVREKSKIGSKTAAFYYCGELEFESWSGDKPITVRWRLKNEVPQKLYERMSKIDNSG